MTSFIDFNLNIDGPHYVGRTISGVPTLVFDRGVIFANTYLSNTPPAPVAGQKHVVGPAPTGDWAGQAGNIAVVQDDLSWRFFPPVEVAFFPPHFRYHDGSAWVDVPGGTVTQNDPTALHLDGTGQIAGLTPVPGTPNVTVLGEVAGALVGVPYPSGGGGGGGIVELLNADLGADGLHEYIIDVTGSRRVRITGGRINTTGDAAVQLEVSDDGTTFAQPVSWWDLGSGWRKDVTSVPISPAGTGIKGLRLDLSGLSTVLEGQGTHWFHTAAKGIVVARLSPAETKAIKISAGTGSGVFTEGALLVEAEY